jgi:hypothetical protein
VDRAATNWVLRGHESECHAICMETDHVTEADSRRRMTRRCFRMPADTLERLRGASSATGTHLVHLLTDAIENHVRSLGGPFDQVTGQLPMGRPKRRRGADASL